VEVLSALPVPVLLAVKPGENLPAHLPSKVEGIVLQVNPERLAELAPFTIALSDRFGVPVLLDAHFPTAIPPSWLESQPELGLVLYPEPEEGLGLNDFSAIDDFLETLDWEM
jgi:hypothetical protein